MSHLCRVFAMTNRMCKLVSSSSALEKITQTTTADNENIMMHSAYKLWLVYLHVYNSSLTGPAVSLYLGTKYNPLTLFNEINSTGLMACGWRLANK